MSQTKRTAIIITDCGDDNARTRQEVRLLALLPAITGVVFCRVESDLQAAGNLVDAIDALDDTPGVVLVNVAPRNGEAKRWKNGAPFCSATVGNVDVFGTLTGHTLDLVYRLTEQPKTHRVYDIPTVVPRLGLTSELQTTQFRSFEILPRLAATVLAGKELPFRERTLEAVKRAETEEESLERTPRIWAVDCFGNCKSTILPEDVGFTPESVFGIKANQGPSTVRGYPRLRDIPTGKPGLTIGSSGLGNKRFLELQVQGGSAAKHFGLAVGDPLPIFTVRAEAAA